ncbi:hypothetical protein CFBP498_26370 [Xanthomonas hortorum pv. vitians]|uniref:Uncharacterized protein n=1 Tax=Xanthomonas hortorum pv. vitians TaxID=83224 RepID=A0A6V7DR70_9XANT|nr:hypothetical protein CFBP498_26370 [Xanthomonas hortorum pv. vitians]CAD0339095.1 hypothetical protein CFBP498_26370 [Xanthomonas hortorum pv. vitians]
MWLGIPVALVTLFLGCGAILSNTPEGEQRSRERLAIELCEKDLSRVKEDPRSTPSTVGFVMDACAKMRNDFSTKWGRSP